MENNRDRMIKTSHSGLAKDRAAARIYLLSFAPVFIIALFASANVLSAFPAVDKYTVILRDIFPAIDRLASVSLFPEVTRLVLAIEWTLVPVQALLFFLGKTHSINLVLLRERRAFIAVMLPLFLGILLWSTAIFYDAAPSDLQGRMFSETLLRLASTTRLGLAIVSSLVMTLTALVIGYFFVWITCIPQIYFDYQGRGQK